ncbi:hypothetical protein [Roseateles toxinivorans]|uniref:hypothetical protein n=1 Tax=Roseateles toxinivorans TaxID=270368 RepID=UPI0014150B80|nr:hypothetical protein [Roseateles toxinivorans]
MAGIEGIRAFEQAEVVVDAVLLDEGVAAAPNDRRALQIGRGRAIAAEGAAVKSMPAFEAP